MARGQWADATLFWASATFVMQPAGFQSLFGSMPEEFVKAFVEDRKAMRAGGTGLRTPPQEAASTLHVFLAQLERQLATGEHIFLFGEQPSVADFSVYHCLWFIRRATESGRASCRERVEIPVVAGPLRRQQINPKP